MSGYELLDRITRLAKLNGWSIATRRGSGSHLTVYLAHDKGERMATIPMHRGKDLQRGTAKQILKRLAIGEWEL